MMDEQVDMQRSDERKGSGLSIIVILGLALALRLYQLGTESLWIDEGYSLRDASAGVSFLDIRPLYYNMLHFWMQLGQSEAFLRFPAVIFGTLTVLLVYIIGKRIFDHTSATIAATLIAISPLHVNHSQEVRMYTLLTFLVTLGMLFFLQYIETGRVARLIPVVLLGFLSFLVFPLSVFMFLTYTVFMMLHFRPYRKAAVWWLTSQAALAVAAIPWVHTLVEATKGYGNAWTWRMEKPGVLDLVWLMRDFNLWKRPSEHPMVILASDAYAFVIVGLVLLGVILGLRRAGWQTRLTLLWLLVPIGVTAIASNTVANMWVTRYMIYASPALYLLMGLGLTAFARRRAVFSIALAGILVMPMGRLALYYQRSERPEWRQAMQYIESRLEPGDSIALYRTGNRHVFYYYYHGSAPVFPLGDEELSRLSFEGWTEARMAALISPVPTTSSRVWFVFSYHEDTGGTAIEDYVERHYRVVSFAEYKRVRIFETRPQDQQTKQ